MSEILDNFRQKYPIYKNTPNDKLAEGIYNKFYAGKMERNEFDQKVGLASADDYQQKPGVIQGMKRGIEGVGIGAAGLAQKAGFPMKATPEELARTSRQLDAQGKGTGWKGEVGEIAGNPLTYMGGLGVGGAVKEAVGLGAKTLAGATAGFTGGLAQGLVTPSGNSKESLVDRGGKALLSGGVGALTGGALPVVAAVGGKELQKIGVDIAKDVPTAFSNGAKYLGMNFANAKSPAEIADRVTQATNNFFDKRTNLIWSRDPAKAPSTKLGEVAQSAVGTFDKRKGAETQMWQKAEATGNSIAHDATKQADDLKNILKNVDQRIKEGEDTSDVKKARALVLRSLKELGAPLSPEQEMYVKEVEKGAVTKTTTSDTQFAPKEQTTTRTAEPTTVLGKKTFSEKVEEPVESGVVQDDKTKIEHTGPQVTRTTVTKGGKPVPSRAATAGDVVRAVRASNSKSYAAADGEVSREVKGILNGGLKDAYLANRQFARYHQGAIKATQHNADIYRDDRTAAKFGIDEETLDKFVGKLRGGANRLLSTADLETINNGLDKIDTPEKLDFYKRVLPQQKFALLLRMKHAAYGADIGTDINKIQQARPMLEKIDQMAGIDSSKTKMDLDALEATSRGLEKLGIKSRPEYDPSVSSTQQRINSLVKAAGFGGVMGNPKQAVYHGLQAVAPNHDAGSLALKELKKRAMAKQLPTTPTGASFLSGVGVAGAMGDKK